MKEIRIEQLSGKNFDEFARMICIFADFEKLKAPDENAKRRLKSDGIGKNKKYGAYLAKVNKKYAGFTIFTMAYGSFSAMPRMFVEDIFLLEEFRGKGVGKEILDFIIGIARKRKCGAIDLNVLDWNQNAMGFYKKNGFEHMNWELYRLELKTPEVK